MGIEGVAVVADFINGNHPLEALYLRDNNISDNDTLVLASALGKNTNLDELILTNNDETELNNNNITEEGNKNLLNALYDSTSMESIVESNHTCRAYSYDIENSSIVANRPPIETEVLNINGDVNISIQQTIRKKVVLALCVVDGGLFDLSHLNDLPLGVMPWVLELIQEHTIHRTKACHNMPNQLEKDALSRLFHTLRGWELPLLFENLSGPSANGGGKKRKRKKTRR